MIKYLRPITANTQSLNFQIHNFAIMAWRIVDSRGNTKIVSDLDITSLRMQYYTIYEVCEKHRVVCRGKRAYSLHLQEEHAY